MENQISLTSTTVLSANTTVKLIENEDQETLAFSIQDGPWIRFSKIQMGEGDREKLIALLQTKKEK